MGTQEEKLEAVIADLAKLKKKNGNPLQDSENRI
jgi:hypothetical protein